MPQSSTGSGEASAGPNLAAAYGRESLDYAVAIGHQHRLCADQAKCEGYTIPEGAMFRYGDNDATGKNSDRGDLQRLIRLVEGGQAPFSRLYVKDRSRFGRWDDPRVGFALEVSLQKHGVEVRYCDEEPINWSDMRDDQLGRAVMAFVGSTQTAAERKKTVERIRIGMRDAVKDGSYPGSSAPYGTERWVRSLLTGEWVEPFRAHTGGRQDNTVIGLRWIPSEAAVIRRIYDAVERGMSQRAIARQLEVEGIPTRNGGKWDSYVGGLLQSPHCMGDLVWGASASDAEPVPATEAEAAATYPIYYENFAPNAPITREQWHRVRKILEGDRVAWERRRATSPKYLLSGLVVCRICGAGIHGHTRPRRKDGSRLRYYYHPPKRAPHIVVRSLFDGDVPDECPHRDRYHSADVLEDTAIRAVREVVLKDSFRDLVEEALEDRMGDTRNEEIVAEMKALEAQLQRSRDQLARAAEFAAASVVEAERAAYAKVVRARGEDIETIERRILQLGSESAQLERSLATVSDIDFGELGEVFDELPSDELKEAVASIVHHIEFEPVTGELLVVCRPAPR